MQTKKIGNVLKVVAILWFVVMLFLTIGALTNPAMESNQSPEKTYTFIKDISTYALVCFALFGFGTLLVSNGTQELLLQNQTHTK
ncbi:hypothetical protein A4S06_02145 [Erysipelotrichaceae bacterium MTC7]|nr:hypothetical protein A4S06_02145 [Erysipelotrichaceae bacterium MTC7]